MPHWGSILPLCRYQMPVFCHSAGIKCQLRTACCNIVQAPENNLKLAYAHYYDNCIMDYLNKKPGQAEELWLVGKDGQSVVINSIFASALLKTVAGAGHCEPSNCVYVPDAPLAVLRSFCQLLHTGRSRNFLWSTYFQPFVAFHLIFSNSARATPSAPLKRTGWSTWSRLSRAPRPPS